MKSYKLFIWLGVLATVAFLVIVPGTWFFTLASLKYPLDSAFDIELHLRQSIESERQSQQFAKRIKDRVDVTWPRPDFSVLPKHFVALYITETGCPSYFQTPREDGWAWNRRLWNMMMGKQMDGDGACELIYARRLARRLEAKSPLQLTAASDRIHHFLQKDELVAFDLHSQWFGPGVIGIEAAARVLLKKELKDMSLAELAELQLGVPPHGYWEDVRLCKNASLVKSGRDTLINHLAAYSLISEEMARNAIEEPVRCLTVKR